MANLNIDAVKDMTYDAIIIGSGVSGGWAAKELTAKGLKVLMLEKGQNLEHVTGYENALKAYYELEVWREDYNELLYERTLESIAIVEGK